MRRAVTLGLVLALAGCGGGEETANKAVPAATPVSKPLLGGVDLDKPVQASGTGPFWTIYIAPGTIAYSDAPDAATPTDFFPVSPQLAEGRAVFETKTPDVVPVTITLTAKPCGAGSQSLPLTAEARIGARILRGCAGPTARRPNSAVPVADNAAAPQ